MPRDIEEVGHHIVEVALHLHRELGPGLLENVYDTVMTNALRRRGLLVERHPVVSFEFEGQRFDNGLRLDLLVDGEVVVELKSTERLAPVHFKQVLTYLRLLDLRLGFLINFGCGTLKEGLHRIVNGYQPTASSPLRINQLASAPVLSGSDPEEADE